MFGRSRVVCPSCGKRFDSRKGFVCNKTMYCQDCGPKIAADEREARTGMRQTMGAMVAKIAAGVLFIFYGFVPSSDGWSFQYFLTAFAIGAGLIAWGLFPYLKVVLERKEQLNSEIRKIEAQRKLFEAKNRAAADERFRRADAPKICPACGATSRGYICEYCGTKLSNQ